MNVRFFLRYIVVPIVSAGIGVLGVIVPTLLENERIQIELDAEIKNTNFAGEVSKFLITSGYERIANSNTQHVVSSIIENLNVEVENLYGDPLKKNHRDEMEIALTNLYGEAGGDVYKKELIEIYREIYKNDTEKIVRLNRLYENNEELFRLADVTIAERNLRLETIKQKGFPEEIAEIIQSICTEKNKRCTIN